MTGQGPISLDKISTYSLKQRVSKVKVEDFGRPWRPGGSFREWLGSLPKILLGEEFDQLVRRIVKAVKEEKTVLLGMGAHPIKVGLNPVILDLVDRGVIKGIAVNGAGIIHDAELAMVGHTSEDVAADLGQGRFGMAEETGRFLNEAVKEGAKANLGMGRAVGEALMREGFPFNHQSLLVKAVEKDIPLTVHVAVGTDIIHFHPNVDGAAIGKTSHLDFRLFARLAASLEGGVFINLGSAVIVPEVFLKALTLVRNLGYEVRHLTTLNMDFIPQYRPMTNVVKRPTQQGGKGFNLVGHHEIMFPLLAAALIEGLEESCGAGNND